MSEDSLRAHFRRMFDRAPTVIAAAPGRVEFIGNHTDYNGGMVLGAAIDRHISVAVALRKDGIFRFASVEAAVPVELERKDLLRITGPNAWVNYPLGVLVELEKAGMPPLTGLDLLISSDLPAGAGLSSSAALEMSSAKALLALANHSLSLLETVRVARRAENHFVGVPCGILDQGVSGFGKSGHLVSIDCATEEFSTLPLPPDIHFWILNSNEKHSLVESFYEERFNQCREALVALQEHLGPRAHLAEISPEEFASVADKLDPLLAKRAAHVVQENARVHRCRELLIAGAEPAQIGALLDASHRSSSELFENSTPTLDLLVKLVRGCTGVFGARLTGGGFGGAVLALTDGRFSATDAQKIVDEYRRIRPKASTPSVFHVRAGDGAKLVAE